jgi:hypothetical protein
MKILQIINQAKSAASQVTGEKSSTQDVKQDGDTEGTPGLEEMAKDLVETGSNNKGNIFSTVWNLSNTALALRAQGKADAARQELEDYKTTTDRRLAELETNKANAGSNYTASGAVEVNGQTNLLPEEERVYQPSGKVFDIHESTFNKSLGLSGDKRRDAHRNGLNEIAKRSDTSPGERIIAQLALDFDDKIPKGISCRLKGYSSEGVSDILRKISFTMGHCDSEWKGSIGQAIAKVCHNAYYQGEEWHDKEALVLINSAIDFIKSGKYTDANEINLATEAEALMSGCKSDEDKVKIGIKTLDRIDS